MTLLGGLPSQVVWRTPMSQAGQASVYLGQKMSIDKQGGESEDAPHESFEGMPDLTWGGTKSWLGGSFFWDCQQ
jgi:hypothetical protein